MKTKKDHYKIKPLKKRVRNLLRISNVISTLLILLIVDLIVLLILFLSGTAFTTTQAFQTSVIISNQWQNSSESLSQEEHIEMILKSFEMSSYYESDSELYINESNIEEHFETHTQGLLLSTFLKDFIQYNVFIKEADGKVDQLIYSNYKDENALTNGTSHMNKVINLIMAENKALIFESSEAQELAITSTLKALEANAEKKPTPNMMQSQDTYLNDLLLSNESIHPIGYVNVRLNPETVTVFLIIVFIVSLVLIFAFSIISKIIAAIISSMAAAPVQEISKKIAILAEGDIETSMTSNIAIKKPVKEVYELMNSTNLIMTKMHEFAQTLEQQNTELEAQSLELESQKDELEAQNQTLEERSHSLSALNNAYLSRTLKLQNLLNNVDQGFLTFESDLLINSEYSTECETMLPFENALTTHSIMDTLFMESEDHFFIQNLFEKIFTCTEDQRNLYMSLLPEEMSSNGYTLMLSYKMVKNEENQLQLLLIMTDISKQRALQNQMEQERNILQMIVKVLQNRSEFLSLVKDFKRFASSDFEKLAALKFDDTLREIHTHKGIFSQYYMMHIANYLNDLEDSLHKDKNPLMMGQFSYEPLVIELEKDLEIIESYVGHDFLYDDSIYTIREERINNIKQRIKALLPSNEYIKILPLIKSIRYKDIREILSTYPDYTTKLGERLGKYIVPFEITGDMVTIDPVVYQKVTKSLIHIFRNSVDHGIEKPDIRLELDKQESASITCHVDQHDKYFTIEIKDDGRGLNFNLLREKATTMGLVQKDETLNDELISNLIFADGISTKKEVSALSGRGVGLAAVRHAVEELGGHITVSSQASKGTSFIIQLPYISDTELVNFTPEKLLKHISRVSEGYLNKLNIKVKDFKMESKQIIALNRISALINVKGSLEAILIISVNEAMGKKLVNSFMLDAIEPENMLQYMEEVLGEVTNTIMGNVLGVLEEEDVYLNLGIPALITNSDAYIKYTQSEIVSVTYDHDDDKLSINLLLIDNGNGNTLYTS